MTAYLWCIITELALEATSQTVIPDRHGFRPLVTIMTAAIASALGALGAN